MKILALEITSSCGSIAWREESAESATEEFANDRKDSGLFFATLERFVGRFGNPEHIVVGLGPGSYAGARIAIAAAIGLQAATAAKLIGLPSICALPTSECDYVVVGDARRGSYFLVRVTERRCIGDPVLGSREEIISLLDQLALPAFTTEPLPAVPRAILKFPSAEILAEICATENCQPADHPLEPIYLREPHITQPKVPAR